MADDTWWKGKALLSHDPNLGPGGAKKSSLAGMRDSLWVGRILHVDTETMVCSIMLETGTGERHDVPLPAPGGGGPRSWAGSLPARGTKVVLGWRRYSSRIWTPYIVQFLSVGTFGAREFDPSASVDPEEARIALQAHPELEDDPRVELDVVRLKSRKAYPGDFLAMADAGAELVLDRDVLITNRAGNEIRVRDADQTIVQQSVNVFESNSAGYFRRGLIKRNAFNLAPDLALAGFDPATDDFDAFVDGKFNVTDSEEPDRYIVNQITVDTPAYDNLLGLGLINGDGTPSPFLGSDPDDPFYPFVVTPDGSRVSYVVHGDHELGFDATDQCYVEDRAEIRNTHDGIMAVTEEGDGVQVDPVSTFLIEDVRGTVVGNDPHTEPGQQLYKRILKMRVFQSEDQQGISPGPIFDTVDTVQDPDEADTQALARLFKVNCPRNSNQYAFGISKEGRVFLHVPAGRSGDPDNKGKSVDANISGLVKAIIGVDPATRTSLDLKTLGSVRLDIGASPDDADPENPEQISVFVRYRGKIRTEYAGAQGKETFVGGNDFESISGTQLKVAQGNFVRNAGGNIADEAFSITHNAGPGGYKGKCAGDSNWSVLGKTTELYAQIRQQTFALADTKTMLAGIDAKTVLAGGIARTVAAGTGITDTTTVGNHLTTVATGNLTMSVGTGNMAATVGAGNLALTAGGGTVTFTSGTTASLIAGAVANITSPITKIGAAVVGNAVAGIPGPPSPHLDYLTGLPLRGVPTVTIG